MVNTIGMVHYDPITGFCTTTPTCSRAYKVIRVDFFLVLATPYSQASGPIFTISTSNDVVSHKRCAFWGLENKILNFDPISPSPQKTANFWQILTRQKISPQKALTMAMLIYELPLIVIVAP